jgi:hypothetical protein
MVLISWLTERCLLNAFYWRQKQKAVNHASYLRPASSSPFILSSATTNTQHCMMWLLDTTSLALSAFFDENTPYYAILSHTWGPEEVSFQDIQGPHERILNKAGYKKIQKCCAKALEAGFKYVWIDTCCIDKTNSVELSEAINSMFRWYQNSSTCYAYLEDVMSNIAPFGTSRWFTRGWTLQELIAPVDVLFFDSYWNEIGSRESLRGDIERVTGVPQPVLVNGSLHGHCIAEIMSWAARRETTRLEDRAYSLLGLFGVSMPLIYGEGEQAFKRLQLEVMKSSTDHSLFAWNWIFEELQVPGAIQDVLATSPDEFRNLGGILRSVPTLNTPAYEMTNRGLRITLPCSKSEGSNRELFAHLNCKVDGFDDRLVGIRLWESREGLFVRAWHDTIYQEPAPWTKNPTSISLYIFQPTSFLTQPRTLFSKVTASQRIYSLDYSNLLKAGYILEAYSRISISEFFRHEDKSRIIFQLGDLSGTPWPMVIFFKHPDKAARVWIALYPFERKLWALIDGSIDEKDTPELILKDNRLDGANKRWDDGEIVEHTLTNTILEGEMVSLTVKSAIILKMPGFMVKVAVLGNNQEYSLGPRPKKRLLPLRELLSASNFPVDRSPPVIVDAIAGARTVAVVSSNISVRTVRRWATGF